MSIKNIEYFDHVSLGKFLLFYLQDICIVVGNFFFIGLGWLNELDSWITQQLIQAYHQCGVASRPALEITKKGCTRLASDKVYQLLAHGRWFYPSTRLLPPLKLVAMI